MATVEKQTRPVEVTTIEEREVVILTLSPEEARVLADVYACLGGDPSSDRKHTTTVCRALSAAGIDWRDTYESSLAGQSMTFNVVR